MLSDNNPLHHVLDSQISECFGKLLDKDSKHIEEDYYALPKYYRRPLDLDKLLGKDENELRNLCWQYLIKDLTPLYYDLSGFLVKPDDHAKVYMLFPEIYGAIDKDGLLMLRQLDDVELDVSWVIYKDSLIPYHPLLRKLRTGSLNMDLMKKLQNMMKKNNLDIRIRIDPSHIGERKYYTYRFEKMYWYGYKFSFDRINNIRERQTSVHGVGPGDSGLQPFLRTEFYWHQQDDIEVLQIEELVKEDYYDFENDNFVINRYVHSEWEDGRFIHLDGAAVIYEKGDYHERLGTDLRNKQSKPHYKLFRIDGKLENQHWLDIVNCFFVMNHFVPEHLGEKVEN